ncbi:hypothetical protein [Veronia pacifica]|uniref:hypothetical protein n=1 Tax=Veronia pacifica TaxID=1080227 RepID=UPI001586F2EB|nr:hypothetical protein [Veronia pacifica]
MSKVAYLGRVFIGQKSREERFLARCDFPAKAPMNLEKTDKNKKAAIQLLFYLL